MAETNKHMPRGAIASPRHELAAAEPHTITGQTPQHFFKIPKKLSFWGDNTYGDCVTAEEAFAKACHTQEIFISDQEVEQWATAHNVLNGAVIVSVMQAMETDGFKQGRHTYDDDGGYKSVNWTDAAVLQNAISHGPVKLGVAADQLDGVYTYGVSGWFATNFHQDSQEDHCVALCGYGTMTWLADHLKVKVPAGVDGSKPGYGEPSMVAITDEAWLRTPTTVIK